MKNAKTIYVIVCATIIVAVLSFLIYGLMLDLRRINACKKICTEEGYTGHSDWHNTEEGAMCKCSRPTEKKKMPLKENDAKKN